MELLLSQVSAGASQAHKLFVGAATAAAHAEATGAKVPALVTQIQAHPIIVSRVVRCSLDA